MSSVRDALGNVVKEGDLCTIELASTKLVVRISEIRGDSGIVTQVVKGNPQGVVAWESTGVSAFDPRNPVLPGILKLHQPERVKPN